MAANQKGLEEDGGGGGGDDGGSERIDEANTRLWGSGVYRNLARRGSRFPRRGCWGEAGTELLSLNLRGGGWGGDGEIYLKHKEIN